MSTKRFLRTLVLTVAAASMLVFAPAALAGTGYVGAAYTNTDSEFETAFDNFDPDDAGWKVFAGYNFVKFFGLEASYRELGTFEQMVPGATFEVDLEAFDVAARGIVPVGRYLSLFAKAGYANIALDGQLDVGGAITDFDEDEWELFYGVGVDINLGQHFGLRAEWEEYDTDNDLNTLSGGAFFRF